MRKGLQRFAFTHAEKGKGKFYFSAAAQRVCVLIPMLVIVSKNEACRFHESHYSALYTAESIYQLID